MRSLWKTATAFMTMVALGLTGCSGGSSASPTMPAAVAPATTQRAPMTLTVTRQAATRTASTGVRHTLTIPSNANSVEVDAYSGTLPLPAPGVSFTAPSGVTPETTACANFPSNQAQTTVTVQVPVGATTITVTSYSGTCSGNVAQGTGLSQASGTGTATAAGGDLGMTFFNTASGISLNTFLPNVINESEGPFSGKWSLNGGSYSASWNNRAAADLTVGSFTSTSVIFQRTDTSSSVSSGMTAVYTGKISPAGNSVVNGSVTWTWPGHGGYPVTGSWSASWASTAAVTAPSNPVPSDPCLSGTSPAPQFGDMIVYADPTGFIVHVGVVTETHGSCVLKIRSKWGTASAIYDSSPDTNPYSPGISNTTWSVWHRRKQNILCNPSTPQGCTALKFVGRTGYDFALNPIYGFVTDTHMVEIFGQAAGASSYYPYLAEQYPNPKRPDLDGVRVKGYSDAQLVGFDCRSFIFGGVFPNVNHMLMNQVNSQGQDQVVLVLKDDYTFVNVIKTNKM